MTHCLSEIYVLPLFESSPETVCGQEESGLKFNAWATPILNGKRCPKCLQLLRKKDPLFSTAIVGSRKIPHDNKLLMQLEEIFRAWFPDSQEIVSGGAKGADFLGKALRRELDGVVYKEFPADWKKLGKSAGVIRNTSIAKRCHNFILITDGPDIVEGSGTHDVFVKMVNLHKSGLHVAYEGSSLIVKRLIESSK